MNQQIEIGDKVRTVFAWREDEQPSDRNFHEGTVLEVINNGLRYRISGLENPRPADRVTLIEKGNVHALPKYVYLNSEDCESMDEYSHDKGFRPRVVSVNQNRDCFEVEGGEARHTVKIRFSDTSDDCFGTCDCMDFTVRNRICKHLAFVGMKEVFRRYAEAA